MIKRCFLASLAALTGANVWAADLPQQAARPYVAPPVFTWTGFYVGANAGAAFNGHGNFSSYGFTTLPTIYPGNDHGGTDFTAGVQAGYNWQFGQVVAGVETDLNYLGHGGNGALAVPAAAAGTDYYTISHAKGPAWYGTLRGRVGYTFDRFLVFGTGGLAYGGGNGSAVLTGVAADGTTTSFTSSSSTGMRFGWTLGAGVEYALRDNISLKAEFLHVDLGKSGQAFAISSTTGIEAGAPKSFNVLRTGINFRF